MQCKQKRRNEIYIGQLGNKVKNITDDTHSALLEYSRIMYEDGNEQQGNNELCTIKQNYFSYYSYSRKKLGRNNANIKG